MAALGLFLIPALLLLAAMYYFLQKKDSAELAEIAAGSGGAERSNFRDRQRIAGYEKGIFSQRDWEFIRSEGGAELEKLFLRERRELAGHWLAETTGNIAAIRRHHFEASRTRQDLDVSTEMKVLAHFCYLTAVCELLAVGIKVMHPMKPGRLAHHVQQLSENLDLVWEKYGGADATETPRQASL